MAVSIICIFPLSAQVSPPADLEPYFNAILVEDIGASTIWYQEVLGFEIVSSDLDSDFFKINNLKRGNIALELIELSSAVSADEAIPDYTNRTRINGLFKMGFLVVDLDRWVTFLQEKEVQFKGDVVQDPVTGQQMVIILDPDSNRIQLFEK